MLGSHTAVRMADDLYGIDGTGDGIGQESNVLPFIRKGFRTIISKGGSGESGPAHPKFMKRGHPWLIAAYPFIANAGKTCPWLHGNDRISQIIGFRPIPCAVVAKLESPNVVQAGVQYFHLLA